MFEKNIKALEKKNPELAKKIKAHSYEKIKTIEVYDSESKNLIISYKGILLHSSEDPLRETKSIWHKTVKNDMQSNDVVVVYGLGLGYLFKRAYVSANSRILLYEPALDILRFVFENVDFSTELEDDRVFVVDKQEDVTEFFENKYLAGDKIEVLFLPSYFELDQQGLLNLSSKLFQTIKDKNIDQNTAFLMSTMTVENLISRFANIETYSPVNILKNTCKDKTALIIAAGPSLINDLEKIKKHREKFIIIAILPMLSLLKEHNIKPDFVTVADSMNQLHKIEKYIDDLQDVNLVLESRADKNLAGLNVKSTFVYFSSVDKISQTIFEAIPKAKVDFLPACASVAILSFRLAELLGCKKIIFSGLDLAMTDNKLYADNSTKITERTDKRICIQSSVGVYAIVPTMIKAADASEVETREDYLIFIREFEKIAAEYPEIKMLNTALKGALIKGMTYQTMEKAVKNIEKIDVDIEAILEKAAKSKLVDFKTEAIKTIIKTKESFDQVRKTVNDAISIATELINVLEVEKPDMENFGKIYNDSKPVFSIARTFATRDLILSSWMQAEIADFIASYNKSAEITLEKLKENIATEKKLFQKTIEAMDKIILIINTTLEQG